jgi:hypothetical protein
VGDLVLLYDDQLSGRKDRKLEYKWFGPYRVKESVGKVCYRIEELNGVEVGNVVHGSRLKRFIGYNGDIGGEQPKIVEEKFREDSEISDDDDFDDAYDLDYNSENELNNWSRSVYARVAKVCELQEIHAVKSINLTKLKEGIV